MIIFLSNCTGNSNAVVKNMAAEEETLKILKALRSKMESFQIAQET